MLHRISYHKDIEDKEGLPLALVAYVADGVRKKFVVTVSTMMAKQVENYDPGVDGELVKILIEGMKEEIDKLHTLTDFRLFARLYVNEIKIKRC